ncbi:MAG: hypothetical protein HZC55_23645 [Verrucomicrobia bacterium]|nr:hypothetical protein [Verrucomicrobiota bacterium]
MPTELDSLFARACDGLATAEELAELHRRLRTEPATLDAWLRYTALHGDMAAGTVLAGSETAAAAPVAKSGGWQAWTWLSWAPQAAAGLVVGLFAASMVWAYVIPPVVKSRLLLDEDFENPAAPLASRTALETGVWRGDAAEIVGAQGGVKPERGRHMMRFLRADFDGRTKPAGGHIAVAYRLIDLRPYRSDLTDGGAVVEVSASFNAVAFPDSEKYGCAISLYALDAESVPDRAGRLGSTLTNDAIAMARSSRTRIDPDPSTWQRLTTELRLPGNAEFLVVRLHISQGFESAPDFVFTGSYVDDVRISLSRRAPLP